MNSSQLPAPYQVLTRHSESHDTVTLSLGPAGTPIATPRPGQFSMLSAYGVGEVPISVSGLPGPAGLAFTVRAVGPVSAAICALAKGEHIGVRGPFGLGWGQPAASRDLLVIAGGIGLAPLRLAVHAALERRPLQGRVTVLVGARGPAELIYAAELDQWRDRGATVEVTVDRADASWTGHVGVVTQLIDRVPVDPGRTSALVCGPEVMMRLTATALLAAGLQPAQVKMSLERNMRCGTAECGHCQLGPLLLCRDGPVVGFDVAEPLLSIGEL